MGYQLSAISCWLILFWPSGRLAVWPSGRLAVWPSSGLRTDADDAVGDKCPEGGDDDPNEEKDEQQRLPDVMAAALLGVGRCHSRGRCWLIRFHFTFGSQFRSRSGIGFRRGLSYGRRHDPGGRTHAHGLRGGAMRRPLSPRRKIAQPVREIVVTEKGAGIDAGTERGRVRDLLGGNIRIDG